MALMQTGARGTCLVPHSAPPVRLGHSPHEERIGVHADLIPPCLFARCRLAQARCQGDVEHAVAVILDEFLLVWGGVRSYVCPSIQIS